MGTYEFTLRLERDATEADASALYASCGDAFVQTGQGTEVTFTRSAPNWGHALGSAIRDVEKAIGAQVVGVFQEDLVTILHIAHRASRTPETVRAWVAGKRGPGGFPTSRWKNAKGEQYWSWPE